MVNGITYYYMVLYYFKSLLGDQIIPVNNCLSLLIFLIRESGVFIFVVWIIIN